MLEKNDIGTLKLIFSTLVMSFLQDEGGVYHEITPF